MLSRTPAELLTPAADFDPTKLANVATLTEADTPLVLLAMDFTRAMACASATYSADPDPNNKHAETQVGRYEQKARRLLVQITGMKANSPSGIRAKALMASHLFDLDPDGFPGTAAFVKSLARDVDVLTGALLHVVLKAEHEAERAAKVTDRYDAAMAAIKVVKAKQSKKQGAH